MRGPSQSSQPSDSAQGLRYVAAPGADREPDLITHSANFVRHLRDYENRRKTRGPEILPCDR